MTIFLAFLLGGLGVLALHGSVGFAGRHSDELIDNGIYTILMVGATLAVLIRAVRFSAQRRAWMTLAVGLICWDLGDLYYALFLHGPPTGGAGISPADALYTVFYPCCYAALMLLVSSRLHELRIGMWLDGMIGGLGAATVAAALALPSIISSTSGDLGSVTMALAYPTGDLLLLVFTIGAIGMTGWRPGAVWLIIAASMAISTAGDTAYLFQTAAHHYHGNGWVICTWPASMILLAIAAWTPWPATGRRRRVEDWRLVLVPTLSLLAALGVFVYGDIAHRLTLPVLILAIVTVLAVCLHLMLTLRQNVRMLTGSRRMAFSDPLTGLGNRRALLQDLEQACRRASDRAPYRLVLYDLNGFKRYNDTFGHPAGDTLLVRLSERLASCVPPGGGGVYRMGGDEFCVLLSPRNGDALQLITDTVTALADHGPGFSVSAAYGVVRIPQEASQPSAVLALADQRLYERKDNSRETSAVQQLRDVLMQALNESHPELLTHQRSVAELALATGRAHGLTGEDLDVLARAAELHDIGKIAIPDAILEKPGELDPMEWNFMRRHTILGERILTAAPALRPVGRLVRSSHERFDGAGYPDGLAGEQIPLGSRIIFVCDAYDAMTSERPYRAAATHDQAIQELRRCAGSQFDPGVVETLVGTFAQMSLTPDVSALSACDPATGDG